MKKPSGQPRPSRNQRRVTPAASNVRRALRAERLEPRLLFAADPLHVGIVYIETDFLEGETGNTSDEIADRFLLSFNGGAPQTELREIRLSLDKDADGLTIGDLLFDTAPGGRGKAGWHPFAITKIDADSGQRAGVQAIVADSGTELTIKLDGFEAGDLLEFSLDIDEVVRMHGNLDLFNRALDVIASGQELQDARFWADFVAPHYEPVTAYAVMENDYGDPRATSIGLSKLPPDQGAPPDSFPSRSAAAIATAKQVPKPISLSGQVWVDDDLDLLREPGEPAMPGVELTLRRWNPIDSIWEETGLLEQTDAQGRYRFDGSLGLLPGNYQIVQTPVANHFAVGASVGSIDGLRVGAATAANVISQIAVPLGDLHGVNYDFAVARPAKLSGAVYRDDNDNGNREAGEPGIGGVAIRLLPIDTIAPLPPQNVFTAADGSFSFTNLPPGRYDVVELVQPAGLDDGIDSPGTIAGQIVGTADSAGDAIRGIKLVGGSAAIDYLFGELPRGEISGNVFLPRPGLDCMQAGPGDRLPLAGVTIELRNLRGEVIAKATTDPQGNYRFQGIPKGVYTLVEITPPGLFDGDAQVGAIGGVTIGTVNADGSITGVAMPAGAIGSGYDFCEAAPAALGGSVYHDANDNGLRDSSEDAIPGTRVELLDTNGRVVSVAITDADGRYRLTGLRGGEYRLREVQPTGYLDGRDAAGSIAGLTVGTPVSPGDEIVGIVIRQGQSGDGYDFGERLPASLSGRVRLDPNQNSLADSDEEPLAGVTVRLIDAAGNEVARTTTDSQGLYRFTGIVPGAYSVIEEQPRGLFPGTATPGDAGGKVASPNGIVDIVLASGQYADDYDFFEVPPARISGYVFVDGPTLETETAIDPTDLRDYRDGIRRPDSPAIAGVTLILRDRDGLPVTADRFLDGVLASGQSVVTDESGYFEFVGLAPGHYSLFQIQPAGFDDGLDTPGTGGGVAINAADLAVDAALRELAQRLAADPATDPRSDAIIGILAIAGDEAAENWFSELRIKIVPPQPPQPPEPPVPPIDPVPAPPLPLIPIREPVFAPRDTFDAATKLMAMGEIVTARSPLIADSEYEVTWHLSIINGGFPRGDGNREGLVKYTATRGIGKPIDGPSSRSTQTADEEEAAIEGAKQHFGVWLFVDREGNRIAVEQASNLGSQDAKPLVGDFNGDGLDEIAVYAAGRWFVDLNGNGVWDQGDLALRLGTELDRPVVGDWDGDGKADIAIFGRAWEQDPDAIIRDPGLPHPANIRRRELPHQMVVQGGERLGRRVPGTGETSNLPVDAVDHVFRFGEHPDTPLAGDWNGDGLDSVGIFRAGRWTLDADGDGRLNDRDAKANFGDAGDIPIVGDWDGNGTSDLGVIRGNLWIIDSDGDRKLTANDLRVEIPKPTADAEPIIGDWDGDGDDEFGYYHAAG